MQGAEEAAPANPLVATLLAGTAPQPLKLSAARGVLPLVRADLLRILVALVRDADDHVRGEATATLAALPEADLLPLLEDPSAPAEVLDHFGSRAPSPASLRAAVISNPATPTGTLRRMASALNPEEIERLLLNLTRLIATPDLLDLLDANPAITPPQRSRTEEIRRHFLGEPGPAAPAAIASTAAGAEPQAPAPETSTVAPAADAPEGARPVEEPTTEAEVAAMIANASLKILRMNAAEKIQLAMKGSREERTILIKDSSKVVQEAVLESPKLSENEVEMFARMRSVSEDVLRTIAASRDWMKNYAIAHALTTNPKTPVGIAMNLVARLTSRDLKLLVGDKNVPEVIRRQARKVVDSRTQKPGSH